jgi:hypothetical protein
MVRYAQKPEGDKEKKVTFFSKEAVKCPVCDAAFHREELFSGRVNAAELTDELHRQYTPMAAFGEVYPLVYDVTVCPSCFYAAFKYDFSLLPPKCKEELQSGISKRLDAVQRVFSGIDFQSQRGLVEGAASYYLALICYDQFPKDFSPIAKQAISAVRAGWLCDYLDAKRPGENYAFVARMFKDKARILYRASIEYETKRKQQMSAVRWLGPDTDKNYGYEGVLYLAAILEYKYGPKDDEARRAELLESSRLTIAKMFGLGKKTKSKPGPLLDKARALYDELTAFLKKEDVDE